MTHGGQDFFVTNRFAVIGRFCDLCFDHGFTKETEIYLRHILECLDRIEEYTPDGRDAFLNDSKTQDAVLRNLQVLAESVQRLPDELKSRYPEIDWRGIGGFRNVLVHDYLGINLKRVWTILECDAPSLRSCIDSMLGDINRD